MYELENIELYKRLEKLDKDFASQLKKTALKIKELINKKTTINFPNYTNHDINHSFKLMNTMYELIKDNKKDFNALEIALMIYSALFHDLGMAISDEEIENIKNNNSKYLNNQNFELIKENNFNNEDLALQEVIRNAHGKIAYDLITNQYEKEFRLPNHESISFAENLAEICLSHTTDKSYVENLKTNTTKGESEYNTQFLAILLRLSDILDIDSTRTPLALFESMNLNDFSKSEWQKNFTIDNIKKIFTVNDLKEIRLEGSCKDIKIHRKILGYIKWIENELRLAIDLTSNMEKKYHILLNTEVKNKIKPIGYTIPDLKLNMDYHAVTNLLMGEAIYGSKNLGLRELLQNSIDAIMVKKDMFEIKNLSQKDTYIPIIEINIDEKNSKFIIKDNGMGMNEYIIKNYFLNVGKSYYKSKDFLNYKHNYNPIGNFGIGFLSCFMLSNEVQVVTKHFNSNKKYIIDLEKNSEYIAFKDEEDNSFESGSEIILYLEDVKQVFNTKEELELQIKNFLEENILIKDFLIKLNNKNLENKTKDLTENKNIHNINISKYLQNIEGEIQITQQKYNNNILDELVDIEYLVYFDGEKFIEIKNYDDLDIKNILVGFELEYIKIPLIRAGYKNNFDILRDSGYLDDSDALHTIYNKQKNKKNIYLFINKNTSTFSPSNYDDYYNNDDYIFYNDEDGDNFYIKDILEKLEIKPFISLGAIYVKKELLNNGNILFPFKKNKYSISFKNTFIKNIKINHNYHNFKYCDLVDIKNINLNIKNNYLQPNISRTQLIQLSQQELTNAIFKVIHEYALENFDLKNEEKELLKLFILMNYQCNTLEIKN